MNNKTLYWLIGIAAVAIAGFTFLSKKQANDGTALESSSTMEDLAAPTAIETAPSEASLTPEAESPQDSSAPSMSQGGEAELQAAISQLKGKLQEAKGQAPETSKEAIQSLEAELAQIEEQTAANASLPAEQRQELIAQTQIHLQELDQRLAALAAAPQ